MATGSSVNLERIGTATEEEKAAFKKTLAGQSYLTLFHLFQKAPDSPDKREAIVALKNAFNDHVNLWVALPQLAK